MSQTQYAAEGHCPYCGQTFERHNMHGVCDSIECTDCHRWFVVKTHVEVTYTTHRIEGEIQRQTLRVAA